MGDAPDQTAGKPPIEVGWMLQNQFPDVHRAALDAARDRLNEQWSGLFPGFDWRLPMILRGEPTPRALEEPVELLDEGVHERDARHLDFVFVVTGADLRTYTKPFALATPSRAVGVAVLSMARLAVKTGDEDLDDRQMQDLVAGRIVALVQHCLADMLGVPHRDDPEAYTYQPESARDLDGMAGFNDAELAEMRHELAEVADPRVEEEQDGRRSRVRFCLRSIVVGREEIAAAVLRAAPWEFPFRLSRLSTAAMSSLLVLMLTEESWSVGTAQPGWLVALLSVLTLIGTSVFILRRQNLMLTRGGGRLTEQNVVAQTAIGIAVTLGMLATYLLVLALVVALSAVVFGPTVAADWAGPMTWGKYLTLGGFIATIGVIIGALGASFEGQAYVRHLTYVDEET